jgi:nicotinamidase-related amidase
MQQAVLSNVRAVATPTDKGQETPSIERNAVLLLIDVQEGFKDPKWGRRNNPGAETKIAQLLHTWRVTKRPVVHVQHLSRDPASVFVPGSTGVALQEFARPMNGELVVQKHVNSAFIGTNLDQTLKHRETTTLVIVGFITDHCVSTTARMAANLGYRTILVSDASATFERRSSDGEVFNPELIHRIHLASFDGEFGEVIDSHKALSLLEAAA